METLTTAGELAGVGLAFYGLSQSPAPWLAPLVGGLLLVLVCMVLSDKAQRAARAKSPGPS